MKSVNKYLKFLIFILFLLIVSCIKKESNEKPETPALKIESEKIDSNTLVFGETRENKSKNTEIKNNGITETEKSDIKGQLLPIYSIKIIPEDMVIGKLLDFSSLDLNSKSFSNSIIVFFKDLEKGIINKNVLHPSWENSIDSLFTDSLIEREFSIRVGEIINESDIYSANIRLISSIGRSSGNVVGDYFEGTWLLSNIAIDLTQLDDIYLKDNMEFNPLNYSTLLLNY